MLKRSTDRKVTNSVTKSGAANIANAFGLPSGPAFSCPGATSVCERICYAGKIEKIFKGSKAVVMHNWNALKDASYDEMHALLVQMIEEFSLDCAKRSAEPLFRIHWDGDFFSAEYARAWATTILEFPEIRFWAYTRTFDVVSILADIPNLSLYLSVDTDNLEAAKVIRKEFPGVRWAFLANTMDEGKEGMIKSGNSKPGAMCPENIGRIPLISVNGSACVTCGLCPSGKADVRFSITKKVA